MRPAFARRTLLASNFETPVPQIVWVCRDDGVASAQGIHELNVEAFVVLRSTHRRASPPDHPVRPSASGGRCGCRPITQGCPLTRWPLVRPSAYSASELGVLISPIHLWRLLADADCRSTALAPAGRPDLSYETKAASTGAARRARTDAPVGSLDQMGPTSFKPTKSAGYAPRKRPDRMRATETQSTGISLTDRARQKLHWKQTNVSPNWTVDIRAVADGNKVRAVPTPTCAS